MMTKIYSGHHSGELARSSLPPPSGERIEEGFVNLLRYTFFKYGPYAAIVRWK